MNVLRLPDYRNKKVLKEKLLYAINAKAGFEFA
jgi:ubiquitin-protein ligase E3 C